MVTRSAIVDAVRAALLGPCSVPEGTAIVAACSGGADSVTLVHALAALAPRWRLEAVVFVDHGTRPVDAERSAARVAADAVGAPLVERAVTLASGNLQAAARAARYDALLDVAGAGALVATGHTRSDQAETVLARAVRGAGLRGLAAIAWREGRVVRPLLGVSRAQTRASGVPFADDPTNATDRFQRNRLRADVLPLLQAENPAVERALAELADDARAELEAIDALMALIPLEELDARGIPSAVVATVARWRHRREIGGWPPRRAAVEALAEQLASGLGGRIALGGGVDGVVRRGRLRFADARDPRWEVVAPRPGTYRLPTVGLVTFREAGSRPTTASTYEDGGAVVGDVPGGTSRLATDPSAAPGARDARRDGIRRRVRGRGSGRGFRTAHGKTRRCRAIRAIGRARRRASPRSTRGRDARQRAGSRPPGRSERSALHPRGNPASVGIVCGG